jgi:periplasmic divalent cation tolerance protein
MAAGVKAVQVMVAVPSPAVARRVARALLQARLCACAQTLGPITSRYAWKGRLETTREWLLLVKTRATLSEAVRRQVLLLHPYEVPEILVVPVLRGHPPYLAWLAAATTPAPRPSRPRRAARARTRR